MLCAKTCVSKKCGHWWQKTLSREYIKLSINHHLMDRDSGLIELAVQLRGVFRDLAGDRLLVLNVRLRPGTADDDRRVREAVERAGLLPDANVFYLQRYGFASDEEGWEPPAPVYDRFTLVNPDGRAFGPDLPARSEAMRVLSDRQHLTPRGSPVILPPSGRLRQDADHRTL